MSYFASLTTSNSDCNASGCKVTFKWTFVPGAAFDAVEITHNASGRRAHYPASDGQATMSAWIAEYNMYTVTARTMTGSTLDDPTKLPGGGTAYIEDPRLNETIAVNLPAPPQGGTSSQTPSKPRILNVVVEDGSLYVTWEGSTGSDIDGYTIAVVENGKHLRPLDAKPSHRAARFAPTIPGTYDIGVAAYNDIVKWPELWEEDRKSSEFDWRRVVVPADKGWPPSGRWQSWSFPKQHSFGGSGRDALTAISREPTVMDVFWIEPVLPTLDIGKIKTAFYRDGAGWGYADLPLPVNAHTKGPISAVSRKDGLVEIFWATHLGAIHHAWWYPETGWQFGLLVPQAGSIKPGTPIAAISRSGNHMEIFWIAPSGAVRHAWWYEGGNWGSGEIAPPGSASRTGGITACSRSPNTMEVFWISADGAIDHAYWYEHVAAKGWIRGRITEQNSASEHSRISVVSRRPETMELFYVTPRTELRNAYFYDGEPWRGDVLHGPGVSIFGGLSVVSRHPDTMEVFWTSNIPSIDTGLHNTFWYDGKWNTDQRSPGYASNPWGPISAVSRQPNTMEVWTSSASGVISSHYIYFK